MHVRPFIDMKPGADAPFAPPVAAAPARVPIRFLAVAIFAVLALLGARAVQLAFAGDPLADPRRAAHIVASVARADIVDRNGELLATTVRAYVLTARPDRVWNVSETAAALMQLFPELDRADLERRLADTSRQSIYLRRSLTTEERDAVMELGLGGLGFETEQRRTYPQGTLAAHALGFTDVDLKALAGVERGLDAQIRAAGEAGRPLRLSLDVRLQHIVETELADAARQAEASGGAAILLDARSGETLAMASWPGFDPNSAGRAPIEALRDRVAGDLHELGSTIKPFTIAMALEDGLTRPNERFDLSQPLVVDGSPIIDHEPIAGNAGLRDILAHSSNIGAAQLALRVGAERQRDWLDRLGLLAPASLESGRRQSPIAPRMERRRDIAGLGFGYGLAATPAALAGAYTLFANQGARVAPTLLAREGDANVARTPVFSPETTARVLSYLRATVVGGTGRAADVPGLEVAGKTGTAEIFFADAGYDESRNFSSFAGLFPASDPRYVIVVALDEPHAESDGVRRTGGAVAAPVVARIGARAAPILGFALRAPD
jgi:cell division protein FtsI (penicillin-binding protein 3)